jgi:hypothetical protein
MRHTQHAYQEGPLLIAVPVGTATCSQGLWRSHGALVITPEVSRCGMRKRARLLWLDCDGRETFAGEASKQPWKPEFCTVSDLRQPWVPTQPGHR